VNYSDFEMLRRQLTNARRSSPASVRLNGHDRRCDSWFYKPQRATGLSSDAMVAWAFDVGPRPCAPDGRYGRYPHDTDDLAACCETLMLAKALAFVDALPTGAIERMEDVYGEFWLWVIGGINHDGEHVRETKWNPLPTTVSEPREGVAK
jgi:hypothetical protein